MISAIVLAAGTSSRMEGKNKLLLPLPGKTPVEIVVEHILASGINDVIVVTGYKARTIQSLLQHLPVRFIHNPVYEKGMTSSIQKGVSVAKGNGYMICLSDMPFVTSVDYRLLKESMEDACRNDNKCICVPVYKNSQGNPVVFSSFYKDLIMQHEYNGGCKKIVEAYVKHVNRVEVNNENIFIDIDTPEDYFFALTKSPEGD